MSAETMTVPGTNAGSASAKTPLPLNGMAASYFCGARRDRARAMASVEVKSIIGGRKGTTLDAASGAARMSIGLGVGNCG